MYIQWCVKGIRGESSPGAKDGLALNDVQNPLHFKHGILCRWWQRRTSITPEEVADMLTESNLDRHVHDYDNFGPGTPFISLAAGCVERNKLLRGNSIYSAIDTALAFATEHWNHPGVLYFCWIPVGLNSAVPVQSVAESIRDLNVYHRWSPYQLEGEITAKIEVPCSNIQKAQWWDGSRNTNDPIHEFPNPAFFEPKPLTTLRDYF